jgi:hypothetical protein
MDATTRRGIAFGFPFDPPSESTLPVLPRLGARSLGRAIVLLALLTTASTALPAAAVAAKPPAKPVAAHGWDVSWPQCGSTLPSNPAFGIVGVNKGIVFSANPCLASEIRWAGGGSAQLYANTGNPGPALSSHWPAGQTSPRVCDAANTDTADCAFDYGWNAAADSYADAVAAYGSLGLSASPAGTTWWLDVETSNSWRSNTALNVAALQGEAAYLSGTAHVAKLGIYSTSYQWGVIAGGSPAFSANKSWVAGVGTLKNAQSHCGGTGFTGGGVALAQYASNGLDADLVC